MTRKRLLMMVALFFLMGTAHRYDRELGFAFFVLALTVGDIVVGPADKPRASKPRIEPRLV